MLATTMQLAGNRGESAGAYLSCAASIGSLLAGVAWKDYQRFQTLFVTMFVRNGAGDLSIKLLRDPQSRVIPNR